MLVAGTLPPSLEKKGKPNRRGGTRCARHRHVGLGAQRRANTPGETRLDRCPIAAAGVRPIAIGELCGAKCRRERKTRETPGEVGPTFTTSPASLTRAVGQRDRPPARLRTRPHFHVERTEGQSPQLMEPTRGAARTEQHFGFKMQSTPGLPSI